MAQPRIRFDDIDTLIARARKLADADGRAILGITGAPGAGKSTLAARIVDALTPDAALVPMDGFHLAERELRRLGSQDRKGAPDTFDAAGFVALTRRLRAASGPASDSIVYAPEFRRDIEEPIAGAIAVPREIPLVVTEGNYLLADGPWAPLRDLLDEVWYLEPDETVRLDRLVRRHMDFGRDAAAARERAAGSDQRNSELIAATMPRADVIVFGG